MGETHDYVELLGDKNFMYRYRDDPWSHGQPARTPSRIWSQDKIGAFPRVKPVPLDHTPYSLRVIRANYPRGESLVRIPADPYFGLPYEDKWVGPFLGGDPYTRIPPSELSRLTNEALIDALQNLKDQKFNAGVAIAEAGGLARMFYDAANGYVRMRRVFLHNDFKTTYNYARSKFGFDSWTSFKKRYSSSLSRAQLSSNVPKTWLYYHFGIKPTLNDLDGAHSEWIDRYNTDPQGLTAKIHGKAKVVHRDVYDTPFDVLTGHNTRLMARESVRVTLNVRTRNGFNAKMSKLGMSNIPEALWNGAPWTWAADYFASFGDWLSVLDAGIGYEFGDTIESHKLNVNADCDYFTRQGQVARVSPYRYRRVELNRKVVGSLYPPMYRVLPRLKIKGPSSRQFANLASAMTGLFGGYGR